MSEEDKVNYARIAGFGELLSCLVSNMREYFPNCKENWSRSEGNLNYEIGNHNIISVRIIHKDHLPSYISKKYSGNSINGDLLVGMKRVLSDEVQNYLNSKNRRNFPFLIRRPLLDGSPNSDEIPNRESEGSWFYYSFRSNENINILFGEDQQEVA